MESPGTQIQKTTVDRKVFVSVVVIGAIAVFMLVVQIVHRMGWDSGNEDLYFWAEFAAEIAVILAIARVGTLALKEMTQRRRETLLALEARTQVETLFEMTDMLQSALGYSDANAVLRATAAKLLPGFGGALYVFNNSGDRLELSTVWDLPEQDSSAESISPTGCWAIKRGKPHLNRETFDSLRCEHPSGAGAVLEIPMMARGEVFGMLNFHAEGPGAETRLDAISAVAGALADAMSLAISNIALREKLRTQALRDPLTGLYNRRYMEDVLERYASLAERNSSPLTVVMIDLDHFKRLNDDHGHAVGDAVLCEVGAAMMGAIRPGDVACRYGGEELVILFPDCTISEGIAKAEVMRARIELLSHNHGTQITASFGVATIPETSAKVGSVLADADAALYRAKAQGRNRVVGANDRPVRSVGNVAPAAAA